MKLAQSSIALNTSMSGMLLKLNGPIFYSIFNAPTLYIAKPLYFHEISWGKNPAPPSLIELWWVASNCAASLAAGLLHNNTWEDDDEQLPFVYQAWMSMGAIEPAELGRRPTVS